ncbi:MAG: hypothetical protein CI952_18 [Methanohalophilus sp.]|jgi:hypothetical protein|nr:MAG: hypothetical protein CI952_18 [Methanohalophilus sp.]
MQLITIAKALHDLSLAMGYECPVTVPEWVKFSHQKFDKRINNSEFRELVREQLDSLNDITYWLPDGHYKLVHKEHFERWLALNPTDKRKYVKTVHDCDDFESILSGDVNEWDSDLAFGGVWVVYKNSDGDWCGHAVNFFIDMEYNIWFVEPQTDDIFRPPSGWKVTKMRLG